MPPRKKVPKRFPAWATCNGCGKERRISQYTGLVRPHRRYVPDTKTILGVTVTTHIHGDMVDCIGSLKKPQEDLTVLLEEYGKTLREKEINAYQAEYRSNHPRNPLCD